MLPPGPVNTSAAAECSTLAHAAVVRIENDRTTQQQVHLSLALAHIALDTAGVRVQSRTCRMRWMRLCTSDTSSCDMVPSSMRRSAYRWWLFLCFLITCATVSASERCRRKRLRRHGRGRTLYMSGCATIAVKA